MQSKNSDTIRGIGLAFAATLSVALFIIPWKMATDHSSVEDMVFILILCAAGFNVISQIFMSGIKSLIKKPNPTEIGLSLALAALTIGGNVGSAKAAVYLSSAMVVTLMRVEIIVVAVLAFILMGEKIGKVFWLGIMLAGVGFYIMQPESDTSGEWMLGSFWAFFSASSFATMGVLTRKYIQKIDVGSVNSYRLWAALVLWGGFNGGMPNFAAISGNSIFLICMAAFLGPVFSRLTYMNSAKYVEARISALVVSSSPVFTLVFAMIILDSVPSAHEIIGGLILMLGVCGTLFFDNSMKKPAVEVS